MRCLLVLSPLPRSQPFLLSGAVLSVIAAARARRDFMAANYSEDEAEEEEEEEEEVKGPCQKVWGTCPNHSSGPDVDSAAAAMEAAEQELPEDEALECSYKSNTGARIRLLSCAMPSCRFVRP